MLSFGVGMITVPSLPSIYFEDTVDIFIHGHHKVSDGPDEEVSCKGYIAPSIRGST